MFNSLAVLSVLSVLSVMSDAVKPNLNVGLSAAENRQRKDPGKALLVTFDSQIGSVALGALFTLVFRLDAGDRPARVGAARQDEHS